MLSEMSSVEVTEWQAYFNIKEERRKKEEAEESAKSRAKARARGY
jgi:hypothetical protein